MTDEVTGCNALSGCGYPSCHELSVTTCVYIQGGDRSGVAADVRSLCDTASTDWLLLIIRRCRTYFVQSARCLQSIQFSSSRSWVNQSTQAAKVVMRRWQKSEVFMAAGRHCTIRQWKVRTQEMYRRYLLANCVMLCRSQRSSGGLLKQICELLRTSKQTDVDGRLLMSQRVKFPDFVSVFTSHYENESCTGTNWQQWWPQCKAIDPCKCLYIYRASYYMTADNS